jgi:hypothetical protein
MDGVNSDVGVTKQVLVSHLAKDPGGGGLPQKRPRIQKPSLVHEGAVRQVAHVAQHTAIAGGFLGGTICVVDSVRTNKGENACQYWPR